MGKYDTKIGKCTCREGPCLCVIYYIDNDKIKKLVQYGYSNDYVKKSLEENEPNYCTAGYYLMGMDQNYC